MVAQSLQLARWIIPERVEKLVLVGTVNNNRPLAFKLMRVFGSPLFGDVVSPLLIGSRRLLRRRMKRVYDRHAWVLDERRVEARHLPLRAAGTQRAIIRTVRGWDAERISRDAHLIRNPLSCFGARTIVRFHSRMVSDSTLKFQESRLIVFLNCGHLPHEEYPEAFVNVVTDFCRGGSRGQEQEVMPDLRLKTAPAPG